MLESSNLKLFYERKWSTEIRGLGVDITPIYRIAKLIDRYDRQTLTLLFTPCEIDTCQLASDSDHYECFTICFATKEAVGKALGTGLVGIDWNEIEAKITHKQLIIHLSGKANVQAQRLGICNWLASWCHWDQHILVHVLAQ
ncbi:MAG: 4'-phosphopantetheinyl transferase superfamily protein [Desmonostoc geniculatum HA4340-LM1]|jgi:holo-[acyl-carrier protein] synthase|nr:4'-phosphopantetheinyl transferase superfamily protein [Desmonostoc geniculatum HA4340-LM1]